MEKPIDLFKAIFEDDDSSEEDDEEDPKAASIEAAQTPDGDPCHPIHACADYPTHWILLGLASHYRCL